MDKEEYIKKHGVSEKEFLYYCINCIDNEFMRGDDNVNDLKGFLYDLVLDHFKLKEKYGKILDDVHDYRYETHAVKMTIRNLCEHFGVENEKELQNIYLNKPYTLKSLCEDEPVWDKTWGCWRYVLQKDYFRKGFYDSINDEWVNFEENRFYPVQKANEGV